MFVETKKEGEAAVKQEPSMAGLVAWLETQPADKPYDYMNCRGECLMGQYLNAIGMTWDQNYWSPGRVWWRDISGIGETMCLVSAGRPHTFGAALRRARAKLGAQQ